jgi:gas vesicle protein
MTEEKKPEWVDALKRAAKQAATEAKGLAEEVTEGLEGIADDLAPHLDKLKQDLEPHVEQVREDLGPHVEVARKHLETAAGVVAGAVEEVVAGMKEGLAPEESGGEVVEDAEPEPEPVDAEET